MSTPQAPAQKTRCLIHGRFPCGTCDQLGPAWHELPTGARAPDVTSADLDRAAALGQLELAR